MPARKTETELPEEKKTLTRNMRFYTRVKDTPKEAQKSFNNGRFSGTDTNPMWRIQKLTELFGPAGQGWWTQNEKFELVPWTHEVKDEKDNTVKTVTETAVFCTLELVYVDPETELESKPITGVGGNMFVVLRKNGLQLSDEAYKMAYTDALSIACKSLGFAHDIYYANDKTKYTAYQDEPEQKEAPKETKETAEASQKCAEIQSRIQKGIQLLTKDMNAAQKNEFIDSVVVPVIGDANYRKCTDEAKLQTLLDNLLSRVKKAA